MLCLDCPWHCLELLKPLFCGEAGNGDGVPEEFLLSELWYCQNHKRNPWFAELVETLLIQPVYSHMARVERMCPAMGPTPIPACELLDIGDVHHIRSFGQYFAL